LKPRIASCWGKWLILWWWVLKDASQLWISTKCNTNLTFSHYCCCFSLVIFIMCWNTLLSINIEQRCHW
jgi:hypothetical protein